MDTHLGICTVPFLPVVRRGEVALISQSGNSSQSVFNHALEMGVGISKFISSGNEADLRFEDYLQYLAQDRRTKVILGYVEGLRDGRRFMELARNITKEKPVVIMKAGRSDAGARAARSHSAALAGSDVVLDAAFKQCGVIRVDELTELVDVAAALLGQPLPRGRRVGVLTMGGGMAVMTSDALRGQGLELPPFTEKTMGILSSMLSGRWSHGNPVDPAGDFVSYHLLWPMIEDENVDAIVMVGGVGMTSSFAGWSGLPDSMKHEVMDFRKAIEDVEVVEGVEKTKEMMHRYGKPVLFTTMVWGAAQRGKVYDRLRREHMFPYPVPEATARVLSHMVEYSEYLGVARQS
jgi:acyl-CoA synthetase (NDP forming)